MMALIIVASSLVTYATEGVEPYMSSACKDPKGAVSIDLDNEAKEFYFDKTLKNALGYWEIGTDTEYLSLINSFSQKFADAKNMREPLRSSRGDITIVSRIVESEHRITRMFVSAGHRGMWTKWGFLEDGAGICVAKDFLNANLNGHEAIISLMSSIPKTSKCLWKVTWISSDQSTQHEIYLEDSFSNGKPGLTKSKVLETARNMLLIKIL
ncbi:MAG: hypothetical protein EOO22_00775 [Comamonadaceae bacterium]|nr:MAG: hypothetical protein EOO22_00775 [Comamonadaceae bacterium]